MPELTKARFFSLKRTLQIIFFTLFFILFLVISLFVSKDKMSMLATISQDKINSQSYELKRAIEGYINTPQLANDSIATALNQYNDEEIDSSHVASILNHTLNDVFKNNTDIRDLQYGEADGMFVELRRNSENLHLEHLTISDASTHHTLTSYQGISTKSPIKSKFSTPYLITNRPWFKDVYLSHMSSWTTIFRDVELVSSLGVSYNTPAFNHRGDFIGVVSTELYLLDLNEKLNALKPYPNSILLVTDNTNNIIASSVPDINKSKGSNQLNSALTSHSKVIEPIIKTIANGGNYPGALTKINGDNYYTKNFALSDATHQLKWQVVLIIPESDVLNSLDLHNDYLYVTLIAIFLLGSALMHFVLAHTTKPLQNISEKINSYDKDYCALASNSFQFSEFRELETGFNNLSYELSNAFGKLQDKIDYDLATGLYTRQGLLNDERIFNKRNLLALIHISNARYIMNTMGERYADELTHDFIGKLKETFPTDIIIAKDTDEQFIVVFPGMNKESDVENYMKQMGEIFTALRKNSPSKEQRFLFSGNAGMVLQSITADTVKDIIRYSWIALQHAEKKGNAATILYSDSMLSTELNSIKLHNELSNAINKDELYLMLQPIVSKNEDVTCTAGECFVRWRSGTLGEIPPTKFIPLAEESGLMIPLGRWIVEEACRELKQLIARGAPRNFRLHINISPTQLLAQGFAWHLMDAIKLNDLSFENICLELQEEVFTLDSQHSYQVISYLQRHGIMISLSDFGYGLSSLSFLHTFQFDTIKLGGKFLADQLKNENGLSVISSLMRFIKGIKVPLIAEGIEDLEISDQLISLGCDHSQGYHFARPDLFASWHCEAGKFYYQPQSQP